MNLESYSNHDTTATRMAVRNTKVVLDRQAKRNRSKISLLQVMVAAMVLVTIAGLYITSPNSVECSNSDVPRHCVD